MVFSIPTLWFPGVTSDTENKYAFLLVAGKGASRAMPQGLPMFPISPASLSHTGNQGDSSNSPLAQDPRAWKSQVTLSSPPVAHQQQWCLREGRGAVVRLHGEGWGGMAVERSTHRVVSMALPSHAQHSELMGCQHHHHSRENQQHNCIASCEANIWEKNSPGRSVGQGFSFSDDSEKLLLQADWGKVPSVDTLC